MYLFLLWIFKLLLSDDNNSYYLWFVNKLSSVIISNYNKYYTNLAIKHIWYSKYIVLLIINSYVYEWLVKYI